MAQDRFGQRLSEGTQSLLFRVCRAASRKRIALTLLGLLVAAGPVQAQLSNPQASTPTTLYFHIFDTFNTFPVNTQAMDVSFFEVGGTNFPTVSGTPVSQQVGDYDFNTIYGFLTSGPVEYDFIENGRPRFHPERGIAADIAIDGSQTPTVYLYLDVRDFFSTDTHPQNYTGIEPVDGVTNSVTDIWPGAPNVLPSFTFDVELRTGNSLRPEDLAAGQVLMSGSKTAHIVETHLGANGAFAGQSIGGTPILVPDEAGIVEWAIPLDVASTSIPKAQAFHVRIDWYQNPTQDETNDDRFAEGFVRLVTDPQHLPRLEMAIRNPVYIESIHPEVAAGILLIHSCVNSPWGTYDVNVANITVSVEGPTIPQELAQVVSQNAHVHGLHNQCAEVTYLWRFRDEGAKNGDYTIHLAVPNLAGTATATGEAGFTVDGRKAFGIDEAGNEVAPPDGDDGKDAPMAVGPIAGLGLLGSAVLRRRLA